MTNDLCGPGWAWHVETSWVTVVRAIKSFISDQNGTFEQGLFWSLGSREGQGEKGKRRLTRRLHINQESIMEAVDMTAKADVNEATCCESVGHVCH